MRCGISDHLGILTASTLPGFELKLKVAGRHKTHKHVHRHLSNDQLAEEHNKYRNNQINAVIYVFATILSIFSALNFDIYHSDNVDSSLETRALENFPNKTNDSSDNMTKFYLITPLLFIYSLLNFLF